MLSYHDDKNNIMNLKTSKHVYHRFMIQIILHGTGQFDTSDNNGSGPRN